MGVMVELGHIVLYVRDLSRSLDFYSEVVGLGVKGTLFNGRAAVLSGGRTHHELMLIEVGNCTGPLRGHRIGLYHVGWKIGDSMDALNAAHNRITHSGNRVMGQSDHTISYSLYLNDPDGNEVELYVDNPDFDWRNDDSWMSVPVKPLVL
jgi:catechol 2,3-dioxygenase